MPGNTPNDDYPCTLHTPRNYFVHYGHVEVVDARIVSDSDPENADMAASGYEKASFASENDLDRLYGTLVIDPHVLHLCSPMDGPFFPLPECPKRS